MNPEHISPRFSNAVIICNPGNEHASSRAEQIRKDLVRTKIIPNIFMRESRPKAIDYIDLLDEFDGINNNTAWVTVGGDGTFSNFAGSLPKSPIMVTPAGYANDMAHMLSYYNTFAYPDAMLNNGRVTFLNPLEISWQNSNTKESGHDLAFGYWGLGLSGQVAREQNQKQYRDKRDNMTPVGKFINSGNLIVKKSVDTPSFEIVRGQNTDTRQEITFINGQRMAKKLRFNDLKITENKFVLLEIDKGKRIDMITVLGIAATKGLDGLQIFNDSDEYHFKIGDGRFVNSQRDGDHDENINIHGPGTEFTVKLSDRHIKVLTSR